MNTRKGILIAGLVLLALYFRASGLFHGLEDGFVYHPDTPKQVANLEHGLHGRYIHYTGSFFTDGYPFGLNRVDEAILRTVRAVGYPVHILLHGEGAPMPIPDRESLFYKVRMLRLLYGMIAFGLLARMSFLLFPKSMVPFCLMLIAAVAPLSSTVTHAASGDVGLDLFLTLMCFALVRHIQVPKTSTLALAGLSVGLAFACKYQGVMGAWVVALYLLIRVPPWYLKQVPLFIRQGLVTVGGFFTGIFLLTPGFWVDPSRTWKLMRQNMAYIKDYGVPQEVLELPIHTRMFQGLTRNIPIIVQALGFLLVVLALVSLIQSLRRKVKLPGDEDPLRLRAFWISIASFPFVVLLVSTAMKPMVQPFHFSFIIFPLMLSVGFLFQHLEAKSPKRGILLVLILVGSISIPSIQRILQEDSLWRKPGITPVYTRFATHSTLEPLRLSRDVAHTGEIKSFSLHTPGLPVFRNQRRVAVSNDAQWWNRNQQLPLPGRPLYEGVPDWIFLNGPFFPNNDHSFRLSAGQKARVYLVEERVNRERLQLGVRSGARPTEVSGRIGDHGFRTTLPPHSQSVLPLHLTDAHLRFPAEDFYPATFVHQLKIETTTGPAWVEVIRNEHQLHTYTMFGPDSSAEVNPLTDREKSILSTTRFLESSEPLEITTTRTPLFLQPEGLPAGSYDLKIRFIHTGSDVADVRFVLESPYDKHAPIQSRVIRIPPGISDRQVSFDKSFEPFEVQGYLETESNDLVVMEWSLRPAVEQRIPAVEKLSVPEEEPLDLHFQNGVHLTGLYLEFPETPDDEFLWAVRAEIPTKLTPDEFLESVLFLHLVTEEGTLVQTLDILLGEVTFGDRPLRVHQRSPSASLESVDTLELRVGVYHSRTLLRSKPNAERSRLRTIRAEKDAFFLQSFSAPLMGTRFSAE